MHASMLRRTRSYKKEGNYHYDMLVRRCYGYWETLRNYDEGGYKYENYGELVHPFIVAIAPCITHLQ